MSYGLTYRGVSGEHGFIEPEQTEEKPTVAKKEIVEINKIKHKDWDFQDERQDWLNYAYDIWGLDFVLTILAENGTMWIDRKSLAVWANWYSDYWLCQVNVWWHPDVLSDGSNGKRFHDWFYDPYKQLDYCYKKFAGGTRFYWYDVRHRMKDKLIFD